METSDLNDDINRVKKEIEQLEQELLDTSVVARQLNHRLRESNNGTCEPVHPDEIDAHTDKIRDIQRRTSLARAELSSLENLVKHIYARPTGGIIGWFASLMPKQPKSFIAVQPLKESLKAIPAMHLVAIAICIAIAVLVITLSKAWPWMGTSIGIHAVNYIATAFGISHFTAGTLAFVAIGAAVAVAAIKSKTSTVWSSGKQTSTIGSGLIRQEHFFRLGAENWSLPTQIWASVMFGLRFAAMMLPVSALIGMAVYGFILMRIYVRTYKKTDSADVAILTTTKLGMTVILWAATMLVVAFAAYTWIL